MREFFYGWTAWACIEASSLIACLVDKITKQDRLGDRLFKTLGGNWLYTKGNRLNDRAYPDLPFVQTKE